MAPLAESIDWVKIRKAGTANHRTLFHWVQACLVMAAETAFGLQRDELDPNNGKKIGGNASAFKLNRKWEGFADDKEWKSRLDGIPTPVNPEFGCGKHTSKKVISFKLPEAEWSESEEETTANVGEPETSLKYSDLSVTVASEKLAKDSKKPRKKRTKPSEMTSDDKARKRRRTAGVAARNILKGRSRLSMEMQSGQGESRDEIIERGDSKKGKAIMVKIKEEPVD